jgi:hypothetical protein
MKGLQHLLEAAACMRHLFELCQGKKSLKSFQEALHQHKLVQGPVIAIE